MSVIWTKSARSSESLKLQRKHKVKRASKVHPNVVVQSMSCWIVQVIYRKGLVLQVEVIVQDDVIILEVVEVREDVVEIVEVLTVQ